MKGGLITIWELARKTLQEWSDDNATQLAAAIAYYTIFSIPPLVIVVLAIAGYFYNPVAAQNQVMTQIEGFIGPQSTDFFKSLLENSTQSSSGPLASLISIVILLAGASGVFYQVQRALNTMWGVPPQKTRGFMKTLKNHFFSFVIVLVIGFLLLVFLMFSAVISIFTSYIRGAQNTLLLGIINWLVLFITITVLFAMIYRVVPDKEITWTDVWLGATITALLFMLGRYAIGFYLTFSRSPSAYGAAGSLIVLLIWIYYSAQIFLFGAEFTQVYSRRFGSHSGAEGMTVSKSEKTPARQGFHHDE